MFIEGISGNQRASTACRELILHRRPGFNLQHSPHIHACACTPPPPPHA